MSTVVPNIILADDRQLRADAPASILTGAFVQLTRDNAAQDQPTWDRQLRAMAAIGMDTLVVQFVASDKEYYYPTKRDGMHANRVDAVQYILAAARRANIRVFLGLHLDHSFWQGKFDSHERAECNRATLDELWDRYSRAPALAGWYIPEEIDDLTPQREHAASLLAYLQNLTDRAHRISRLPVMISPFFGQRPDAAAFAQWWDEVALPSTHVDIVALQDGVGTHRTGLVESRSVFAALAPVMKRHRVAFWANNECFDQTHGWPVDEQSWSAQPTSAAALLQQIQTTAQFVEKSITFEFCHYLDPARSSTSRALYLGYQDYLRRHMSPAPHLKSVDCTTLEKVNDAPR